MFFFIISSSKNVAGVEAFKRKREKKNNLLGIPETFL